MMMNKNDVCNHFVRVPSVPAVLAKVHECLVQTFWKSNQITPNIYPHLQKIPDPNLQIFCHLISTLFANLIISNLVVVYKIISTFSKSYKISCIISAFWTFEPNCMMTHHYLNYPLNAPADTIPDKWLE